MRENIKVKERLRIVVVDKNTGKTIRDEYIVPKPKRKWLDRILGRKSHATILAFGFEQMIRFLGNTGTTYPINQLATNISTVTSVNSVAWSAAAGTLYVNNSADPFTITGNYDWIKTTSTIAATLGSGSFHNSIDIGVDITTDQQWWGEVELRFS